MQFLPTVDGFRLARQAESWYNTVSKQTEDLMRDYSFGNFLHELRSRRGLTQYQLGALVGVSSQAVSKWENGTSKPQSGILYKLSEILGISVDELLTCQYHVLERKDSLKGIFAMKDALWSKALHALHGRYGNPAPMKITNRFYTEQADMQGTPMIVYLDMLATLADEARNRREHIRVSGGTGASLVAYLLGATEVNPLKPHYYCPNCRAVTFVPDSADGWDLPSRRCACGRIMTGDGHRIPYETYRHVVHRSTSFDVSTSPRFLETAKGIVKEYFRDCPLTLSEREDGRICTFTVSSEGTECTVTLCAGQEFSRYQALEQATATSFDRINFCTEDVLAAFREGNTEGIPEFKTEFSRELLGRIRPTSFRELIRIPGLAHGTGVWHGNGEELILRGVPADRVIAYRDDVFTCVQDRLLEKGLTDTGFAYRIMENTRRGLYAKSGIPEETVLLLRSLDMGDPFIRSIGKIRYLFPKAHGVTYVKLAATLMWYKLHSPQAFRECLL